MKIYTIRGSLSKGDVIYRVFIKLVDILSLTQLRRHTTGIKPVSQDTIPSLDIHQEIY